MVRRYERSDDRCAYGSVVIHDIHVALAWLSGGAIAVAIAAAVRGEVQSLGRRRWLDRSIIAVEVAVVAALLAGLAQLIAGPGPSDPLHFLYAALLVAALPVARMLGGRERRPRRWVMVLAGVVALGLLVRLAQTGGS
jgi:hypothetical protein